MVSGGRGGAWKALEERIRGVTVEEILQGAALKVAKEFFEPRMGACVTEATRPWSWEGWAEKLENSKLGPMNVASVDCIYSPVRNQRQTHKTH